MLTNNHSNLTCQLDIAPQTSLIDEPVAIRVSNVQPGQSILLRAQVHDEMNRLWESQAVFIANAQGVVDVTQQAPLSGSYSGVDPMGLFWSMSLVHGRNKYLAFVKTTADPLTVTFTAEVDSQVLASVKIQRLVAASWVVRMPVNERGLVATLFLPSGLKPYQPVIVLSGSDGGMHEEAAALLASRGYASLALAYIQGADVAQGLPRYLVNIQLSYFETAIKWLLEQDYIEKNRLTILGHSRGGELALLLGATFPQVRAVIAGSPSSVIHSAITTRTINKPAWQYQGNAFPYVNINASASEIASLVWKQQIRHVPVSFKDLFVKAMSQQEAVREATIPVEKIHGPVLLISGQDDRVWPSNVFAEQVVARLKAYQHSYSYEHLTYAGAGHLLCSPYGHPFLPPMLCLPVGNLILETGGSAQEQTRAAADSWFKILTFLQSVE